MVIASTIKMSCKKDLLSATSMQVSNNTSMRVEKGVCQIFFPLKKKKNSRRNDSELFLALKFFEWSL